MNYGSIWDIYPSAVRAQAHTVRRVGAINDADLYAAGETGFKRDLLVL